MPDSTVGQLASGAPALGTDLIYVERPGAPAGPRKLTVAEVNALPCNRAFPATQVPSADPNMLDDYEEGSYTPTLTSSAGTVTSTTGHTGWYVKTGQLVKADARAQFTNVGTGTNAACLSLPFTSGQYAIGGGCEVAVLGCALTCNLPAAGYTQMFMNKYDATTAVIVNWSVAGGISYIA